MSHGKIESIFNGIFGSKEKEYFFLLNKYSESQRFYHTLDHIEDCLNKLDEIKEEVSDLKSIQIALLYHDLYYDPKRKDNEEKSATYIFELMRSLNFEGDLCQRVRSLILLTIHPSIPKDGDDRYLLDIDLSILGAAPEKFAIYEENIRKEYKHVPNLMYKMGRKKLLKKFLNEERIYNSEYFHEKLEEQARSNLWWAIERL